MENDADTSRPAMPRQPSGDQLGFSFDEPHFAPIIPNILIIEPSTPDRSDSSRNSTEERGYGFVDLVPPEEDKQEKAPEPEKDQKEEHHEGEIVEDMTVSSSPLNERHAIRTVAQMTPTNVDDVPIKEVLDRILTKEALPVRPPTQPEENPPSPSLLLPPENLEITSERMPVVQFTPEVIREHELAEEAAAAAANNRRLGLWERCCIVM